jgi:tetratricopeptide (TPR) repeat protein
MADDARIQQLLDELHDQHATPEEVCRSCPELLPIVRNRWQQMCRVRANLDALFPPADEPTLPAPEEIVLPHIPGYEVEGLLGRGGMGVVFRARHLQLNRVVALKMALAGAFAEPRERARFQREAEAVAGLRHANVVQIYDVGETDGRPYFTMEYMEGGSLARTLAGRPQPAEQAAHLVTTLAGAVQAAHACGIVHRDLKPGNVLLSADGTPKISDFGLARRLEPGPGLTQSGVIIGTPSYMAPEQARGQAHAIGPAVDVYALGAILYELLTGRPPFHAETSAATLQQVMTQDPVPPARLNPAVPRDLETICLKCLHKESQRRYASATALADDLKRLAEGRPILARPASWGERGWRWGRRNPAAAALLATVVALVGLASGGGVWLMQQRAERRAEATRHEAELRSDVSTAVAQGESLRNGFHFHQARELLEQARQRLEAGPDDLRLQVEQSCADLELAERLDAARVQATTLAGGKFNPAGAEPMYASAIADAGLDQEGNDIDATATRVHQSSVSAEIITALDDWASVTPDRGRRAWLLAVARKADPDPVRDRLRQPELWQDGAQLTRLARELGVSEFSPQLTATLGRVARANGGEAIALLTAAQARFPQDFRLNFELGWALVQAKRLDEALGHFRAALALRPEASAAHNGLGAVLSGLGRTDEAIAQLQEALRLDPKFTVVHYNLGSALLARGRPDEAIEHFQQALRADPQFFALAHLNLGIALSAKGRLDEAIGQFEQSLRKDPRDAAAHTDLGIALRDKGRLGEAIDHFQQALSTDPKLAMAQTGLGLTWYDAARAAVRTASSKDPKNMRLDEPKRAGLRRQALSWLQADLELTMKLLNDDEAVAWSLATWQADPAMTSVRDPAALAKLPATEREEWQRFWTAVAALVATEPVEQGRAWAVRREWAHAADCYARAFVRGPTEDGNFWFEYAALLLLSGDRLGYARACAHLMERCGKNGEPRSYLVARACTLAPGAVADAALPGRLAEVELRASPGEFWSLTEQGALAYRAGRFQPSATFFAQSLQANPKPGAAVLNWLWLALANERLGKLEEARTWLGKAQSWLDQYRDGMPPRAEEELGLHFHNWLEAHVLRHEAEALMQPTGSPSGPENGERGVGQK